MSFHRYIVPPPLALAVEPAPPPKPHKHSDSKDHKKDEKPADKGDKKSDAPKGDEAKAAGPPAKADKAEQPANAKPIAPLRTPTPEDSPLTPGSANSMIPEPPTPVPDDAPGDNPAPVPAPKRKSTKQEEPKSAASDPKSPIKETLDETEEEPKADPVCLLAPAPYRPLRTRLELNPSKPYPPINTDPRGAYFKYARGVQAECILIDVTKDGWLVDQWKEKPEREALARLRGETDKQRDREVRALERKTSTRKVPRTSEEILLQLWNDLAEAPSYEILADNFWGRYDWSDPEAAIHLRNIKRPLTDEERAKVKASSKDDGKDKGKERDAGEANPNAEAANPKGKDEEPKDEDGPEPPVPWTCAGLEEVLGTVGVQCAYKTEKPLTRHWAEPAGAYLVMAHGFFMLRVESHLQWKTEEAANSFELLKTSHNDRVFGEMVKAQQMEERKKREIAYRERKAAEKRKAEQEAKKAKVEGREPKDKGGKKDDNPFTPVPDSPASNVAVKDGKPVKHERHGEFKEVGAGVEGKDGDVIVAVPVKEDKLDKDAKHEPDLVAVPPKEKGGDDKGKDKKDEEKGDGNKKDVDKKDGDKKDGDKKEGDKKDPKDAKKPHNHPAGPPKLSAADAKLLKDMIHGAGMPDSLAMEDIHLAFKAIEKAAEQSKADERNKAAGGPLIWTWQEPCEKWRWRNHEASLQNVDPGGWEERDWKVFADGRGCEDYDKEEEWAEQDEEDLHDWSC